VGGPGVHLGSAQESSIGPRLQFLPLPYPLLEDI
jgi:hypothetical protein